MCGPPRAWLPAPEQRDLFERLAMGQRPEALFIDLLLAIEQAVVNAFLEAVTPAAVEATMLTVQQLQTNHDAALSQWRLEVERARYEAERAERRYQTVEPEKRLVARGLETEWENRLRDQAQAEAELRRREQGQLSTISPEQLKRVQMLGSDLGKVWTAPTTTDRDRKELLRTLLEEVIFDLKRAEGMAYLTLRWRGGAITLLDVLGQMRARECPWRNGRYCLTSTKRYATGQSGNLFARACSLTRG
jgi:hypothetical protein